MKQRLGHRIVRVATTIVAASSTILAPDAWAGEGPKIAITRVTRTRDAADSRVDTTWARARLDEEIDARLRERFTITHVTRCGEMDPACSLARARRGHATYLVRATLVSEAADHRVRLEIVRPDDGHTDGVIDETCEICGRAELEGFVQSVAGTLLRELESRHLDTATRPRDDRSRRSRALSIAGWSVLGAGAATTIAGGILWGMDGRPHRQSCRQPDAEGQCPNIYASRTGGIAVTATGLTALGVGAAILIAQRVRARRSNASSRAQWNGAGLRWSF